MTRFFVEPQCLQDDIIRLTGENALHARVLRLKRGEKVLIGDASGKECLCSLTDEEALTFSVLERRESDTEAKVRVSVFMALPKADKLEHVIQKATELGAFEIVTFPTARCISRPDEKSLEKKRERWQKIAVSAAEQSGRGRIPQVRILPSYRAALEEAAGAELSLLFYENEHARTLRASLESGEFRSISLMTGPEGGLEESEVALARELGLQVCTLGKRILRCETAPLCALAATMFHVGEF